MNDSPHEKAYKWDKLVKKVDRGDSVVDIEGERWLRVHPDMKEWAAFHADMIEWMTAGTNSNHAPRSDCG